MKPGEPGPSTGLVDRTLSRLLMQSWQVAAIEDLTPRFRVVDFVRRAPANRMWVPGSKIQIKLEGLFVTRTYTPVLLSEDGGSMRIIAYLHGSAPGSDWVRTARIGEIRPILGPRSSLDLSEADDDYVLFGDETSVGLAVVLAHAVPDAANRFVFEASVPAELQTVLDRFGLDGAKVLERQAGGRHLAELPNGLRQTSIETARYVLTGGAPSIQIVGRALRRLGVPRRRILSKVYWAPGKVGLD